MIIRNLQIGILTLFLSLKISAQTGEYIYLCYAYDAGSQRYGYINTKGQFAIKPQYLLAFNFSDNRAFVQFNDSTWGLINYKGEKVYSLPDTVGKEAVKRIAPAEYEKRQMTYMDQEFNGNITFLLSYVELKDSFLIMGRDWFSDSFNSYLVNNFNFPNSSAIYFYYHIKRGVLKDKNGLPVYNIRKHHFSENLLIVSDVYSHLKVINNDGHTVIDIPDSIYDLTSKTAKILSSKFCNGKMYIYEFAEITHKDKQGVIQKYQDESRFKREYIISNSGKILIHTDTARLNVLCDSLLYHKAYSKTFRMSGDIYSAREMHYSITDNSTYGMAYDCDPPADKNFLKPFTSSLFMRQKTLTNSENDNYKYNHLIGFWDGKYHIKIKPRINGHIGKEFRKVYK